MDPAILIIILFVVAPLLERLLKARKGDQKTPPGQRPGPGQLPGQWPPREQRRIPEQQSRTGASRQDGEHAPAGQAGAQSEEQTAAGMLPDDLWEILTGERRMPPPTRPPTDDEYEPEFDDEIHDVIDDEITSDELGQQSEATADDETWRRPGPAPWVPEPPAPVPPTARQPARPLPAPVETRHVPTRRPAERAAHVREVPDHGAPQVVSLEQLTFDDDERHDRFHERLEALPPAVRGRGRARPFAAEQFTNDDLRRAIIMAEVLGTPRGLE